MFILKSDKEKEREKGMGGVMSYVKEAFVHPLRREDRQMQSGRQRRNRRPERRSLDMAEDLPGRSFVHQASLGHENKRFRKPQITKKYSYIPDHFTSLQQVTNALRQSGLESSNLLLGIDFTKSNEWTGRRSFHGRSLHAISEELNPYEQAITIIGKALAPFDEDNLIPCFGFGDATTHDEEVFSFHHDQSPCHGFEEVLNCYRRIVPNLRLSGPTSFAPIIEAAVDIVEKSGGQYHILVIIADGQVTRSVDTEMGDLSTQERKTIGSIVMASSYPLSIVLVGVGDGPWEDMKKFDDRIPSRDFDNFQFVNFTSIMESNSSPEEKEASFALAALMEVPFQYKASMELDILGHVTGKAKHVNPRPPPIPFTQRQHSLTQTNDLSQSSIGDQNKTCPICLTNDKDMAFGCGHMCCRECAENLTICHICRATIRSRIRLYSG